jgi:hypothetical protein
MSHKALATSLKNERSQKKGLDNLVKRKALRRVPAVLEVTAVGFLFYREGTAIANTY